MKELRMNDVRLRGCGYTLYPAAESYKVQKETIYNILVGIYKQLGVAGFAENEDAYERQEAIKKANPTFPEILIFDDAVAEKGIENDLLEKTDDGYVLTEKAKNVFEKAATIQNELDNQGFHCCPCHGCC